MTRFQLIWQGLRYHWRTHLGTLVGCALSSAILTGALLVGDSVRGSLREMALARLGRTQVVLDAKDRTFRAALADDLARGSSLQCAPALRLPGTASRPDGTARANRVQVLGVTEAFWRLANQPPAFNDLASDSAAVGQHLAAQLRVAVGDTLLVRFPKPSALSPEAPLAPSEGNSVAMRLRIDSILSDAQLGRFGLAASQLPALNVFVSLSDLQAKAAVPGRANLLLVADETPIRTDRLPELLRGRWELDDAELELNDLSTPPGRELRSKRIFLDPAVTSVATNLPGAQGLLTYFVNELQVGDRTTPYSMITAAGAPWVPAGLKADEIVLNQWLAEDLNARPGDELRLTFYVVGLARKLEEQRASFRVHSVVPIAGPAADRSLMPDFPGLTTADNCRDWDAGFPIQTDRIRDQDEKYWDDYRGTPKAFVTLATGQKLWGNRFGNLTAVRFAPGQTSTEDARAQLLAQLTPESVGLVFEPIRERALAATAQALDFGQLFLGFSLFLIAAALMLTAMLFQLGLERRATEFGTLLALGFRPTQVRRLAMGEAAGLALLGSLLGLIGGYGYAKSMIYGLSTTWSGAVAGAGLSYHGQPITLALGAGVSLAVAWITIALTNRQLGRKSARELLAQGAEESPTAGPGSRPRSGHAVAIGCALVAFGLCGWATWTAKGNASGAFFGSGALLLVAALLGCRSRLHRLATPGWTSSAGKLVQSHGDPPTPVDFTLAGLAQRNAARRSKRSLTTLGLLACGSFLIASIGVFRLEPASDTEQRASGTGGFAFIGETASPLVVDLNTPSGQQTYGLAANDLKEVAFVGLRVRDGEDASCLNLNRAQKPRLVGVKPEDLDSRTAFRFAQVAKGLNAEHPWRLLNSTPTETSAPAAEREIPAIGDQASILWALGKKVGDTIAFTDERGRPFRVRLVAALANSILQGSLLIDEAAFVALYPSEPGYRMLLLDVPSNRRIEVAQGLSRALQDIGLELTATASRLAAFNAVQNTYLSTFQVLGGLGLLLGSVGLSVVVARNVLERRSELALLSAVGLAPRRVRGLVLTEHLMLLSVGLGIGVLAAMVAVLPTTLTTAVKVPLGSLALTLTLVLLNGLAWTWVTVRLTLRGRLLAALRNE